jgi:hypothetical protein
MMMLAACTKEGDTIYQPDPDEPKASTAPLVTVIYGTDALGDRSYSDLIFKGVEEAAAKFGLRTMQKTCVTIALFNAQYLAMSDIRINTHTHTHTHT